VADDHACERTGSLFGLMRKGQARNIILGCKGYFGGNLMFDWSWFEEMNHTHCGQSVDKDASPYHILTHTRSLFCSCHSSLRFFLLSNKKGRVLSPNAGDRWVDWCELLVRCLAFRVLKARRASSAPKKEKKICLEWHTCSALILFLEIESNVHHDAMLQQFGGAWLAIYFLARV
jgi:hypothetical protein